MFLFYFLSHSYTSWSIICIFLCFSEMVDAKRSARLRRGLICFCSHLFRVVTFRIFAEETKIPLTGSDWRECMILSISTSAHTTSKHSDCTLSQGLHPSGHQHPDNIGITLWLRDLHSCNVLSTLGSCLYCLGLNFCVYKDLTNTHIQNVNI